MTTRFPILLSAAFLWGCPETEKQPSSAGAFEQRAMVRIDALLGLMEIALRQAQV